MSPQPAIIISGYTEDGYGAGPGLVRFALDETGWVGEPVAKNPTLHNPSFVAHGGEVLLATAELPHGGLIAVDPQSLAVIGKAPSGGADTCHVALIAGNVWAANYSSGTASITPLSALLAGTAAEPPELVSNPGSGPVADRQGESHAHQVTATAWGTVLVANLGSDRVDEYSARTRVLLGSAELPPGTGPRHVALKGDFLLVAGELDGHLHVLRRTPVAHVPGNVAARHGGVQDGVELESGVFWRWLFKAPLAESSQAIADVEQFFPSHIQLSSDGNLLYAAVRGPNTLVVLDVAGLGIAGNVDQAPVVPTLLGKVASGGDWPRHFALSADGSGYKKLYVANQLSNNAAVFDLDEHGLPGTEPIQSVEFGSPACVLLSN